MSKGSHTPNNPSKAPNIPTGPKSSSKGSKSKVMSPMPKASSSNAGLVRPAGSSSINSKASGQTVQGGPKR